MRRTLLLPAELPDPGGLFIERQELTPEGWETKVLALAYGVITREQTSMLLTSVDLLDGNDPPCWAFLNLSIIYREPGYQPRSPRYETSDFDLDAYAYAVASPAPIDVAVDGRVQAYYQESENSAPICIGRTLVPSSEEKDDDIPW